MSLSATIDRSIPAKYVNYFGDGNGRDSYIVCSNGGLAPHRNILNKAERPGFLYSLKARVRHQSSSVHKVPSFDYISDGSGRDSYILQNSGGLKHDFKN
jgi:hypothetical protein